MTGTMRSFFLLFRLFLMGLSASLLIGLIRASPVYAQGPTVNTTLDNESDTCAVNNCTLREAIADAISGDTITFDSALSGQTITLTGGELLITKTLTFSGPGASLLAVSGNHAGRVFNISAGSVTTISGLTIQDGAVSGLGGGILNTGQLMLTSVVLTNNVATSGGRGGGLYVDGGGQATLIGGQVISNTADSSGGGLSIGAGTIVLSGTQVLSNTALPGGSGGGAFVWQSTARLQVSNSLFQGNQAWWGGSVFVESGTALLTDTQIISNSAGYGAGIQTNQPAARLEATNVLIQKNTASLNGGGLQIRQGVATLTGTQIISNSATNGGGLFINYGTTVLTGTQVISNSASQHGGGGYVYQPTAAITVTTGIFENNTADSFGGGLYIHQGTALITGTQILSNTAKNYGGGLYVNQGTVPMTGIQIVGNNATNGGGLYIGSATGTASLSGGQIHHNHTTADGGGLYTFDGTATLTGTQVFSNTASRYGGGIHNQQGTIVLTGGQILDNSANYGGGLYNLYGTTTLTDTQILGNSANYGGGLYANQAMASFILANVTLEKNTASYSGGGGFLASGIAVLTDTQIISNSAQAGSGGGMFIQDNPAVITATNSWVRGNMAHLDGGGFYVNSGRAILTTTHLLDNRADRGGGLFSIYGYAQITDSCIVNNSDMSIDLYRTTKPATNNWWGDVNGPAGAGPGDGDAVSSWVDYSSFKTTAPSGCPNRLIPAADAGTAQAVNTGVTVTLNGNLSTDAVGEGLTYFWQQTGGITVTISGATTVSPTFTAPLILSPGVLTFTLTVTDALHRADTSTTTVTVDAYHIYLPLVLR